MTKQQASISSTQIVGVLEANEFSLYIWQEI